MASGSCQELPQQASQHNIAVDLLLYGRAYDLGIIRFNKLIEVVVSPLLKLASRIAAESSHNGVGAMGNEETVAFCLYRIWRHTMHTIMCGGQFEDSRGRQCLLVLRGSKRVRLVKALLAANYA